MSRFHFLECNRCEHRISYKAVSIGADCHHRGPLVDCGGQMFVLVSDNPEAPSLATFKRKYGRRGASLILRQAISASQCGERLDTDVQADILSLANELDELCGD